MIEAWELILPPGQVAAASLRLREGRQQAAVAVYLSQVEGLATQQIGQQATQIDHFPRHGFRPIAAEMPASNTPFYPALFSFIPPHRR